jgi:glycolate oxidase FAD binding subunit
VALNPRLESFADEIGGTDAGPVCVRGGATTWHVGGAVLPGTRQVRAPRGIVSYEPAEMTVRVGAGTTVGELHDELAAHRQVTALDGAPGATVGGVLVVGRNGLRRLRHGPLRDALLEARYVSAEGRLVKAGGPTVKNVTGFDLCRLLVGSLGTLGLLGEVTLRTRPQPETSAWFSGDADRHAVLAALYRPASVLWDGRATWVLLEGYGVDVDAESRRIAQLGLRPCAGPPTLPPERWVTTPAHALEFALQHRDAGPFVAELGVGIVHASAPQPAAPRTPGTEALQRRLRDAFDPTRRLNPGRDPRTRV